MCVYVDHVGSNGVVIYLFNAILQIANAGDITWLIMSRFQILFWIPTLLFLAILWGESE